MFYKHASIYWKRLLFQVLTCLCSQAYSKSRFFIVFFFRGVYCIELTQPSVMFYNFYKPTNYSDTFDVWQLSDPKSESIKNISASKKWWKFIVCLEISSSKNSYYSQNKQLIDTSNQLRGFYMTRNFTEQYFRTYYKNTKTQIKFTHLY